MKPETIKTLAAIPEMRRRCEELFQCHDENWIINDISAASIARTDLPATIAALDDVLGLLRRILAADTEFDAHNAICEARELLKVVEHEI